MFSWAYFAAFFAHILPYDFIVKELTRISREEKLGTSVETTNTNMTKMTTESVGGRHGLL